jgi:hypothetical protein
MPTTRAIRPVSSARISSRDLLDRVQALLIELKGLLESAGLEDPLARKPAYPEGLGSEHGFPLMRGRSVLDEPPGNSGWARRFDPDVRDPA